MNFIVTGASRGIGFESVKLLLEKGHQVITLSRSVEKLESLANNYDTLTPIAFDLSQGNFDHLLPYFKKWKVIHGILNNAGLLINKPTEELTDTDLTNLFNVNVIAPIKILRIALPYMKHSELKHVVNVSSMGGFQGSAKFSGLSAYSASKSAVACLAECWAEEYKEVGIKANALAIGAVQTEMLAEAFPGYEAPLSAQEMANFMVNFLLNESKYYNGKTLPVSLSTP